MLNIKTNLRLFDEKTEFVFLMFPLLVIALVPLEFLLFGNLFNRFDSTLIAFVLNAVFFNTTHVILTYLMLMTLPEMKEWVSVTHNGKSYLFWLKIAGIFIFFFGLFLTPKLINIEHYVFNIFMSLVFLLPLHHAFFQVWGLSLSYNQSLVIEGSIDDQIKIKASEKLEKIGFYLFFFALIFIKVFKTKILQTSFGYKYSNYFYFTFWVLLVSATYLIVRSISQIPKILHSNKPLYLLRLIAFPLTSFSFFAASATSIIHGLEYVCVFTKMNKKSQQGQGARRQVLLSACGLLLIYGAVVLWLALAKQTDEPNTQNNSPDLVISLVAALSTSLVFVHYYLDRIIFRMREPQTRKLISPLLSR